MFFGLQLTMNNLFILPFLLLRIHFLRVCDHSCRCLEPHTQCSPPKVFTRAERREHHEWAHIRQRLWWKRRSARGKLRVGRQFLQDTQLLSVCCRTFFSAAIPTLCHFPSFYSPLEIYFFISFSSFYVHNRSCVFYLFVLGSFFHSSNLLTKSYPKKVWFNHPY